MVIRAGEWFLWTRDEREKSGVKSPALQTRGQGTQSQLRICGPGHPPGGVLERISRHFPVRRNVLMRASSTLTFIE